MAGKLTVMSERTIWEAIILHYQLGWSHAKVAKELGVSRQTITYHLARRFVPLTSKEMAHRILNNMKDSEAKRGIQVDKDVTVRWLTKVLDEADICALTGWRLVPLIGNPQMPSADRIDPRKGYKRNNIQIVAAQANIHRHSADMSTFVNFCAAVAWWNHGGKEKGRGAWSTIPMNAVVPGIKMGIDQEKLPHAIIKKGADR